MTKQYTYRDSHKKSGKGVSYDENYKTLSWRRFLWSREQDILLAILQKYFNGKDIHLLDFACGTGRIASFLEDHVKTSTGVDVSSSMLEIARVKLKRTKIIQADITEENILQGKKFNLVTAFRFFLNAESDLRSNVIKALGELLSEDGYFVFNNHQSLGSLWTVLSYIRYRQKNPQHIYNVMTIQEMKELVETVGLEIIEIYPVGFFHPPIITVPLMFTGTIENIACKLKCLARFSESPVAVCRWKKVSAFTSY